MMGIVSSSLRRAFALASPEHPSTPLSAPADWLYTALGGSASVTGRSVNRQTAMACSAVYACVSLIARMVASVPWQVFGRDRDGNRETARDHPLYRVLHDEPNTNMTSYTYRQHIMASLLLEGNAYSAILRRRGQIRELLWLDPQRVEVARRSGRLIYTVTLEGGGTEELDQVDMLHIPGIGWDGLRGMSVITAVAREPVGLALSMEEYVARLHANASVAKGVIEAPTALKPETWERLLETMKKFATQQDAIALPLDNGMKWNQLQLSPNDVQTIEERRFQVADIARIFGVPPHMIGETDKSTSWGTGLEQQTRGFVTFTLRPWLVSIEQEINRKLLRQPYYSEFNLDSLLRGDSKTQAEVMATEVGTGVLTINEARRQRNRPPIEGGDRALANNALKPITELGQTTGGS